ncbi:hypothetical protein Ccrd_018877 [Cynara cardunculus var. scolymus]|uniref:Uncharacterized protein n=1 Tax=Cynara cardunculus var. scolymus TaxID=59895 RepID=A0A118K1G1_CYNCS|nr:hypothetical protein Ccrd_018877 [Cynara cardunculus var. scolymus]
MDDPRMACKFPRDLFTATSRPSGKTPLCTYPNPPCPNRFDCENPSVAADSSLYEKWLLLNARGMFGGGTAEAERLPVVLDHGEVAHLPPAPTGVPIIPDLCNLLVGGGGDWWRAALFDEGTNARVEERGGGERGGGEEGGGERGGGEEEGGGGERGGGEEEGGGGESGGGEEEEGGGGERGGGEEEDGGGGERGGPRGGEEPKGGGRDDFGVGADRKALLIVSEREVWYLIEDGKDSTKRRDVSSASNSLGGDRRVMKPLMNDPETPTLPE